MEGDISLVLEPKLIDSGSLGAKHGLRLLSAFDPTKNDVAISLGGYDTVSAAKKGKKREDGARYIFWAAQDDMPTSRRALFTSTYFVWTAVQRIAAIHLETALTSLETGDRTLGGHLDMAPPDAETVKQQHTLAQGYLDAIAQYVSSLEEEALVDALERSHAAALHHIMHLAQVVYIPGDGRGDSVVGEEILDWINRVNIAPRDEEAASLRDLADPFRSDPDASWEYLYRCVLRGHHSQSLAFLRLLHSDKDKFVAETARHVSAVLAKRPRSADVASFPTSNAYLAACRSWRKDLARLQQSVELEDRSLEDRWSRGFLEMIALASGDEDRILDRCQEYGWQDALGAWLTLVRPACTRDDLPCVPLVKMMLDTIAEANAHRDVMRLILAALPIDPTDPIEAIYTSLLRGNVASAIQKCQEYDVWLATHLTDLLDKLQLIDRDAQSEYEFTLRDYLTLNYADYLRTDPGLWRLSIDYLASCGLCGRARMRAVLLSVTFRDPDLQTVAKMQSQTPLVRDVLEICAVYGLEDVAVAVCKIVAEQLVRQRQYGQAVAYCVRAGDSKRVARIADRLLNEYLTSGASRATEFARLVDAVPSSLLHPAAQALRPELFRTDRSSAGAEEAMAEEGEAIFDGNGSDADLLAPLVSGKLNRAAFAARLVVLGRLRDFITHHARGELSAAALLLVRMLDSGVAPKRIWAALLMDAVPLLQHSGPRPLFNVEETHELLRCLEEVTSPIATAGVDSSGLLDCLTSRSKAGSVEAKQKEALQELLGIRHALATNLARCFTVPLR